MDIILNFDQIILNFISITLKNNFFDAIMPMISSIDNHGEVWIIIALILCVSKNKAVKITGITMLAAMLMGAAIGQGLLKNIIARPRPIYDIENYKFLIAIPDTFSFPSGHTTSSFAAFFPMLFTNNRYKFAALVLACAIAFSRMYLHVHYPTDIIGGIVLGLVCAVVAVKIVKCYVKEKDKTKEI